MQDQSNCHCSGKEDGYGTQRHEAVLSGAGLVCVCGAGRALSKQIWATRGHHFQRDLFWEVAEICGRSKEITCKVETIFWLHQPGLQDTDRARFLPQHQTRRCTPAVLQISIMVGVNWKDIQLYLYSKSTLNLCLYPLTMIFIQLAGEVTTWWVISQVKWISKTTVITFWLLVKFWLWRHVHPLCSLQGKVLSTTHKPSSLNQHSSLTCDQAQQVQLPPTQWDHNICTCQTQSSSGSFGHHNLTHYLRKSHTFFYCCIKGFKPSTYRLSKSMSVHESHHFEDTFCIGCTFLIHMYQFTCTQTDTVQVIM